MKRESHIDPLLNRIEFPGEEESLIRTWLESRSFTDAVVSKSRRLRVVSHHSVLWGSALVAVVGSGVAAARSPVLEAAGGRVATFAFLLFGVLITASVVGFLVTLHPSWYADRRRDPGPPPEPQPQTRL